MQIILLKLQEAVSIIDNCHAERTKKTLGKIDSASHFPAKSKDEILGEARNDKFGKASRNIYFSPIISSS